MDHINIDINTTAGLEMLAKKMNQEKNGFRHEAYIDTKKYAAEMSPHAFSSDPSDILMGYRPLEEKLVGEYRKQIYEATTATEFKKALNVVTRIFSEGFFSIHYPDKKPAIIKSEDMPQYFFETYFSGYGNVIKYGQQVLTPCMLGDPNAVLIIDRKLIEDGELYNISPRLMGADRVYFHDKELGIFIVLEYEKSPVKVGNKNVYEGSIYTLYSASQTIRITQTGEKKNDTFDVQIIDDHNIGMTPVTFLGGEVFTNKGKEYYKSFFDAGLPYWNKIVREESDLDASVVRHAYPQRVRMDMECSVCSGTKYEQDITGEKVRCHACNGSGVMIGNSPYKDIVINQKIAEDISPSEVIHVVEESTTILEFMSNRIEAHKAKAMEALNMNAVNGVNNLNSGEAKKVDRQDLNLFLKKISDQVFDLIEFIYEVGIKFRYSELVQDSSILIPQIVRPIGFDYVSLSDLIEETKLAREANLHPSIIRNLDKAIAVKKYGKHAGITKRIIAEIDLDPYYGENIDSLLTKQSFAAGSIDSNLMYLSINMSDLITEAIENDKKFIEKDRKTQKSILLQLVEDRRKKMERPAAEFNVPVKPE